MKLLVIAVMVLIGCDEGFGASSVVGKHRDEDAGVTCWVACYYGCGVSCLRDGR